MSENAGYKIGHGGQQVIKAPKASPAKQDKGTKIQGKDLRAGKK